MQSSTAHGWGAEPTAEKYRDLAGNIADRQAVECHPHVCVMAAEK